MYVLARCVKLISFSTATLWWSPAVSKQQTSPPQVNWHYSTTAAVITRAVQFSHACHTGPGKWRANSEMLSGWGGHWEAWGNRLSDARVWFLSACNSLAGWWMLWNSHKLWQHKKLEMLIPRKPHNQVSFIGQSQYSTETRFGPSTDPLWCARNVTASLAAGNSSRRWIHYTDNWFY